MSIKNQKKIIFVPILNILPLILFVKLRFKHKSLTIFFKQFIKMAIFILMIIGIRLCIIFALPEIGQSDITAAVCNYLFFVVMSYFSIEGQILLEK